MNAGKTEPNGLPQALPGLRRTVKRCLISFSPNTRRRVFVQLGFFLLTVLMSLPVELLALDVGGRVLDERGEALPLVRLRFEGEGGAPFSVSVFSGSDGAFSKQQLQFAADSLSVEAFRIGWQEKSRTVRELDGRLEFEIRMSRLENVASQVPGSAWLRGGRDDLAYRMTTLHCSNCHQLGAERVRRFAAGLASIPVSDRAEAWLKRAATDLEAANKLLSGLPGSPSEPRIAAWESLVQYMRYATLRLGEHGELRWGLKEGSPYYEALLQPETSLFVPRDMAIVIPKLAYAFPVDFSSLTDYDDIQRLGEYGVTPATVIEEFALPTFGWTREVALAPESDEVWFVETDKDRLGALDPTTGAVAWYPIPGEGQQGPHTMNADADGYLWIALEDSFHIARFDTKSRDWRLYPPPEGTLFGVTHDFAFDSDRHVAADQQGRIWITDLGKNELWALHVDSGEIRTYRMPLAPGESHFHSLLYGAAIDVERNRVWWAQLYGHVGAVDTERNIADRVVPFARGAGPRRLAIQDDGTLWVPLFGSSELVRIDGATGEETGRYRIPDQGASPYGITLDKRRNAIWAATSNSDRIYRFDIEESRWRHYPLPRREAYIRMVEVDPQSGDVWTTYSSLPVGARDPAIHGTAGANNMIVRLHPGD